MTNRPSIPQSAIDDVNARTDLVELVDKSSVKLVKSGHEWIGLCPFHSERTPSFTVRPDKGFVHCFGCGAHENAIGYQMRVYGQTFIEAIKDLAWKAGVDLTEYVGRAEKPAHKPKPKIASRADEKDRVSETEKRRKRGHALWQRGLPIADTEAEEYLANYRGIDRALFLHNGVHRFVPDYEFWYRARDAKKSEAIWTGPALLSVMQYIDDRFAACHVTCIDLDQPKGRLKLYAPDDSRELNTKRVMGDPSKAAIRLGKPAFKMVGGEGLETTYSGMMVSGLSGWCSYSLDNLVGACLMDAKGDRHPTDGRRKLPSVVPDMSRPGMVWPRECHERIFLGDGDTKDIYMLKAKLERGCRRAAVEGRVGRIAMSRPGTDFNSMILGAA